MIYSFDQIIANDKVEALFLFIKGNLDETDGDAWIHGLDPIIESWLDGFSESEWNLLEAEVLNWNEDILIHIAIPILLKAPRYANGDLIFAKIFLQIEHLDNQLYLVSDIHGLSRIPDGKCEISWYNELKDKVINLKSIFGSDYYYGLEYIDLKIRTETEYRASLL